MRAVLLLAGLALVRALHSTALADYDDTGDPQQQYDAAFLHGTNWDRARGTGVEGEGDPGTALLYYTFAGLAGHVPAAMTVGYRHWVGIGTPQSCQDALGWYKQAADEALRTFNAGPPGGRHLPPPKVRLSDLQGGPYGPGASTSFRPSTSPDTQQEWEDLLEFHHFHAERGDPTFMYRLGRLYYSGFGGGGAGGVRGGFGRLEPGAKGLEDGLADGGRDFSRASKWFMRVAKSVWPKDPPKEEVRPLPRTGSKANTSPAIKRGEARVGYYDETKDVKLSTDDHFTIVAGLAAGFLGRMYLRGEGVRVDYAKAFLWFMRGSTQGDRESRNGIGIMFRDGLGVARDMAKAKLLFGSAAQQDLAEAQVNLGKYYFGLGELHVATQYFELAIRQGDQFQAYYYLAELASMAAGPQENCPAIVSFYKLVTERGDWEHEVWWEAERAHERGDSRTALLGYWIMAERGYEVAQNNVAWILDRDKKRLRVPFLDQSTAVSNATDRIALTYWTRSAAQDNVDALLKMGDYYYAGLGSGVDSQPQAEKAAGFYRSAANSHVSAMAMWNLGWMHENGKGVAQDFHLAKRYYDQALETSLDAYFPVTLALVSLHLRSLYHTLFIPTSPTSPKPLSLFKFLNAAPLDALEAPKSAVKVLKSWSSFGRAWREIQRRWGFDPGQEEMYVDDGGEGERIEVQRALEGNEELPVDWGRRDGEGEGDEYFDFDGDGGDIKSTLAIISLCLLLAFLLNYRQNRIALEPQHFRAPAAAAPIPPPVVDEPPAEQGGEPGGQF